MSPVIPRFELSEEHSRTGAHILNMSGELHVSTAPHFAQRFSDVIYINKTAIVLDMTAVEFIDSTGLSVMLNALRVVTQIGGRLALVCTNPTVLRLFAITNLDNTFEIFDDRPKAIAYVLATDQPDPEGDPSPEAEARSEDEPRAPEKPSRGSA
ncbi:MAG TPA: STAS domain-containing protein [Solirubrobacteraceae bacterium]|nr:STAS domain-containing protein [Solirubrobacteraceae bacterium]